jgi:hypothetical protein
MSHIGIVLRMSEVLLFEPPVTVKRVFDPDSMPQSTWMVAQEIKMTQKPVRDEISLTPRASLDGLGIEFESPQLQVVPPER